MYVAAGFSLRSNPCDARVGQGQSMKFGIVVFPGSNCEADCYHVIENAIHQPVEYIWHEGTDLSGFDCIVLPGGFAYGDYLRAGAIARFSPVMGAVEKFAQDGGLVIGICNGFQVLVEAGLLPGALMRNDCLEYRCQWQSIRVDNADTPYTGLCRAGDVVRMPIGHGEGRYYADPATLDRLNRNKQVILRYCEADGSVTPRANPNGSLENIAGICSERFNIFGLMPHPDRSAEAVLGGDDGGLIFESIVAFHKRQLAQAVGDVRG